MTTQDFLNEKVNFKELIEALDVDEMDVITAAKNQAVLYLRAARYRVKKMRARVKAKSFLEAIEAEKALLIRNRDTEKKAKKTESNIKQLVLRHPEVQKAIKALSQAEEEEELAKRLLDAYDHRGKAIRIVADLMGYEVSVEKRMSDYKGLVELKKKVGATYPGAVEED